MYTLLESNGFYLLELSYWMCHCVPGVKTFHSQMFCILSSKFWFVDLNNNYINIIFFLSFVQVFQRTDLQLGGGVGTEEGFERLERSSQRNQVICFVALPSFNNLEVNVDTAGSEIS